MSMPDIPLSFRAKNSTVTEFKELVDERASHSKEGEDSIISSIKKANDMKNSAKDGISSSNKVKDTELDKALYDKALGLPEAKTISLKYTNSASEHQYGTFKGGQVYVNWYGNIDQNNKNVPKQDGWLTLNRSSFTYALFTNDNKDYIIRISDFTPKSIVEDFQPLYDKLKELKYQDDSVKNDTKSASSEATTHREGSSLSLISDSDQSDAIDADRYSKVWDSQILQDEAANSALYFGIYPRQIGAGPSENTKNDSVYNNVQAVIYDLPGCNSLDTAGTLEQSCNQLFCYQQPDSVSYTAAAQYDPVSPRGSQQPLQFYNNANAMSLSFTLKWHIDEIRTLAHDGQRSYTIQEIADIAEGFTRPWDLNIGDTDQSLQPKLCKVILPGVSQIGYITEAQINFSGDMSGDYTTGSGVLTGSDGALQERAITNYFYSQLEVTFSLTIVKDITLIPLSSAEIGIKMQMTDKDPKNLKPLPQKKLANQDNGNTEQEQPELTQGELEAAGLNNTPADPSTINQCVDESTPDETAESTAGYYDVRPTNYSYNSSVYTPGNTPEPDKSTYQNYTPIQRNIW